MPITKEISRMRYLWSMGATRRSTLPVREMVAAMKEKGIPSRLSYSAGAFVCNDLLYTLLHKYEGSETRVAFIHVPFLPEQAKEGVPSMPLETITEAIKTAIEVI